MHRVLTTLVFGLFAAMLLSLAATTVRADNFLIVPSGPQIVQPAGLGTVNTVLVIQTKGSSTNGFGSVAYNPNARSANRRGDVVDGSQIVGGANNQTYSATELGLTNGDLCIMMNINDPNKGGSNAGPVGPIILNSLVLTAYDNPELLFSLHNSLMR